MRPRYRYSSNTRTNVGTAFSSISPSARRVSSMGVEGEATKYLEQEKLTHRNGGRQPQMGGRGGQRGDGRGAPAVNWFIDRSLRKLFLELIDGRFDCSARNRAVQEECEGAGS